MPHYVLLMNWTDQGARAYRDSADRADTARGALAERGVTLKDIYWTIGALRPRVRVRGGG